MVEAMVKVMVEKWPTSKQKHSVSDEGTDLGSFKRLSATK